MRRPGGGWWVVVSLVLCVACVVGAAMAPASMRAWWAALAVLCGFGLCREIGRWLQ
jgi:hypothetical protein